MSIKKVMKYFKIFVLFGVLLMSVGCTEKSSEEMGSAEHIQAVLHEEFNGPGEELKRIWDELDSLDRDALEKKEKYAKKYRNYVDENLQPHYDLPDGHSDLYLIANAYNHLRQAHANGYELKIKDITIEESEKTKNSYSFTMEVSYAKEGSKQSKTLSLKGLMNTNEKGKIIRAIYHNDDELEDALRK